jgi:hypothetical protein
LRLALEDLIVLRTLTSDRPAVAAEFLDQRPDLLAEGLRSLKVDHHVGEPGGMSCFCFPVKTLRRA